jgi:hypothetical protein
MLHQGFRIMHWNKQTSKKTAHKSTSMPTSGTCRSSGSGVAKHKWSMGGKCAKEEVKAQKQRECAVQVQAWAAADMVATNVQKAQVLQDQATLNLFTMPGADRAEVAEYLSLCWQEELAKLKEHLDNVAKKPRIEAVEKVRVNTDNAAKVAEAMRQQVPPSPFSQSPSPIRIDFKTEDARAPSPPPETRSTPSSDLQFRIPEQNRHQEEDPVGTQQSIDAQNINNWRSSSNHQMGDVSMADEG